METKKFVVINRARKYFAATLKGYKCKILIDQNSENLELGEQELLVEDISVRSKYGTDLIFKLAGEVTTQKQSGVCTLKHARYNSDLVKECRKLGGQWDATEKVWVFNSIVQDKVDELDEMYNSDDVTVEIRSINDQAAYQDVVDFCGYTVAKASSRDSGAKLGDGVALIRGSIDSRGSRKNWKTWVEMDSIFRLSVPSKVFDEWAEIESEYWKITRL